MRNPDYRRLLHLGWVGYTTGPLISTLRPNYEKADARFHRKMKEVVGLAPLEIIDLLSRFHDTHRIHLAGWPLAKFLARYYQPEVVWPRLPVVEKLTNEEFDIIDQAVDDSLFAINSDEGVKLIAPSVMYCSEYQGARYTIHLEQDGTGFAARLLILAKDGFFCSGQPVRFPARTIRTLAEDGSEGSVIASAREAMADISQDPGDKSRWISLFYDPKADTCKIESHKVADDEAHDAACKQVTLGAFYSLVYTIAAFRARTAYNNKRLHAQSRSFQKHIESMYGPMPHSAIDTVIQVRPKPQSVVIEEGDPNYQGPPRKSPKGHDRIPHYRTYKSGKVIWIAPVKVKGGAAAGSKSEHVIS